MSNRVAGLRILVAAVLGVLWAGAESSLRAVEYFSEDFQSYVDDLELVEVGGWQIMEENTPVENAAWTLTNPGGRGPPAGENGVPAGPDGLGEPPFLISDSDAAGGEDLPGSGMSHDIWSPAFNCAAATTVWLHMDCVAEMNNNGLVVFDVDVSSDGGTTWTNAFRRVAPSRTTPPLPTKDNADGFLGRLHVNITAHAAGKPSVMFRLRQFEPNDDWWIAVDNVVVDDQPVKSGAVNLLFETFSNGIPVTWTVRSEAVPPNEGTLTWNSEDACQRSTVRFGAEKIPYQDGRGISHFDAGYAIMDSDCDPDPPDNEYLITPAINCASATEVYLHYKSEIVPTNDLQEVLLSLDGGSTFEDSPIFSYYDPNDASNAGFDPGEDPFFAERVFAVPEAAGQGQVAFAWHYSSGGNSWYWAVDDVKVSANGNGLNARTCVNRELTVKPFDPATSSVTMSWKGVAGDGGFRILANGTQVGADLPSSQLSFTDAAPPPGGSVAYSLQVLVGGSVEIQCDAPAVSVISCPRDLACCANQAAKSVSLSWTNGVNLAGTGYRILRNGIPRATVPLTDDSFLDSTLPGPGTYDYQLVMNGGNPTQCPDLPLKCRALVLGDDLIFYDDFDCYLSDAGLQAAGWQIHEEGSPLENAAWTVTDRAGRGNPPNLDGTPTTGKFIISDSDAAGGADGQGTGRSHDIWTPKLNCTGRSVVWLHAACVLVLNNNGLCVFDTDVSADDGATWTNVFRRVAPARSVDPLPLADIPEELPGGPQVGNADAFFGQLDVDLSAVAANQPNVRIRFRQFEPDDDWWMSLDNVLVDTVPLPRGSRALLEESFTDDIPPDWIADSATGLAPWRVPDLCNISLLHSNGGLFPDAVDGRQVHHLDNEFAHVFGDETCAPQVQDEKLITPVLDCSGTTAVYLSFQSDIVTTAAVAEVLVSTDGGATFDTANPLFSYNRGAGIYSDAGNAEAYYNEYTFPVPQAIDQKKVVFAFHYFSQGAITAYWAIDKVTVTADGGGIVDPQFHRGDADANGQLQLTDAVRILNVLFLGTGTIPCQDAADADDNGQLQLTDAVRILNVLFLGTGVIPLPGPPVEACGADPTKSDALDCAGYDKC